MEPRQAFPLTLAVAHDFSNAADAANLCDAVGRNLRPVVAGSAKGHAQRTVAERRQLAAGDGGALHRSDSRPAAKFRVCFSSCSSALQ